MSLKQCVDYKAFASLLSSTIIRSQFPTPRCRSISGLTSYTRILTHCPFTQLRSSIVILLLLKGRVLSLYPSGLLHQSLAMCNGSSTRVSQGGSIAVLRPTSHLARTHQEQEMVLFFTNPLSKCGTNVECQGLYDVLQQDSHRLVIQ